MVQRFSELFSDQRPITERFSRLIYWERYWQMFLDFPVFGVSLGGASKAAEAYYIQAGHHDTIFTAHQIFLQFLGDSGLTGFIGFIGFILGFFVAARRSSNLGVMLLLTASLLGGLLQNNFRDSEYIFTFYTFVVFLIILPKDLSLDQSTGQRHQNLQPGQNRTGAGENLPS
jgi:O-antigen ligase